MLEKASAFIDTQIPPKSKLLLACSGGVDSMVLLHILQQKGHQPALAHCNFQLREAAEGDKSFVQNRAQAESLTLHCKNFNTQQYAQEKGLSTQIAARNLRYAFFAELTATHHYQFLLTAHHLDDSLETFFINLSRATGLSGLTGIPTATENILRPLGSHTKAEVLAYAHTHQIAWREDESNASLKYQRNFLRHKVIPALRDGFEGFNTAFNKSLRYLQEQEKALNFFLQEQLQKDLMHQEGFEKLPFSQAPYFKALLHYWLQALHPIDYEALKRVEASDSDLDFSTSGFELFYSRGFFWLNRNANSQSKTPLTLAADQHRLQSPFPLKMERASAQSLTLNFKRHRAYLDFEKLTFPLTLRPWQEGDRFIPLGMQGHKKLSDFFTDLKLNRADKNSQWVLCSGTDIVWVVGRQIHEHYKITDQTKTIYFVQLLN